MPSVMNWFARRFRDIKDSFYNPAFYAGISRKSFGKAVGFLFFVSTITSLVSFTIIFSGFFVAFSFLTDDFVEKRFPAELSIHIQNGIVSTSVEEPYVIPFTPDDGDFNEDENILIIDTRADVGLTELSSYNAIAVLTKDHLILMSGRGDRRLYPLSAVKDVTVNKELMLGWYEKFRNIMKVALIPATVGLFFVTAVFTTVTQLVMSLVGALLVLGIGMFRKTGLSYGGAYKVALYATGPILIMYAVLFPLGIMKLPFYTDILIFALFVSLNLKPAPAEPLPPAPIP